MDLFLKIFVTFFIMLLFPVYWKNYGPGNFLWLSDISLFLSFFALWFNSPLLLSVIVLAILPVEIFWNVDFFYHLATGKELSGIATYMFDPEKTLFLRSLSLFHVFMPLIWLWYLVKWGYDRRAFKWGVLLNWAALILSYFLTEPEDNINWVHTPEKYDLESHGLGWVSPAQWLIGLLIFFPVFVYWPFHRLLLRFAKKCEIKP